MLTGWQCVGAYLGGALLSLPGHLPAPLICSMEKFTAVTEVVEMTTR